VRERLWQTIERVEKRKDSQLREMQGECASPVPNRAGQQANWCSGASGGEFTEIEMNWTEADAFSPSLPTIEVGML
jgi:hypothetical protein